MVDHNGFVRFAHPIEHTIVLYGSFWDGGDGDERGRVHDK
jgi:hypothetical protein